MRRRPFPRGAEEHRRAAISSAHRIREIADDLNDLNEYDRIVIKLALSEIRLRAGDIERWLTLAKYGVDEEHDL